jgi:hypothetical protein
MRTVGYFEVVFPWHGTLYVSHDLHDFELCPSWPYMTRTTPPAKIAVDSQLEWRL